MHYGIRGNRGHFASHTLQVFLVGLTLGSMRTVVPALAESEFGLPRDSFVLLTTFVVAFGVVKGVMNFVAGRLAERLGRKQVLVAGWLLAWPIPLLVYFAPSWFWIVLATVLLGISQGLTWSMTQTAKLDITRADQRGLVIGLNEFAGYSGMAIAGVLTAVAAQALGPREGLLWFGLAVIGLATALSLWATAETLPWAHNELRQHSITQSIGNRWPRYPNNVSAAPSTWEIFTLMSWRDRRLAALCQAGLVEKFVDALVWVFWPIYLHQQGLSLLAMGSIVGIYGMTWGVTQLLSGPLSDRFGRVPMNVGGMVVCAVGVLVLPMASTQLGWSLAAALTGLGMAMLYPNLSAAVADIAMPAWRASAIGIYRFWRDLGYAVGALALGLVAAWGGEMHYAFWFVGIAMILSAAFLSWMGEETHPRINPAV